MVLIAISILFVLLIIIIFLLYPLTIKLSYRYSIKENHSLTIIIKILRIPFWKRTFYIPPILEEGEGTWRLSSLSKLNFREIHLHFKRISINQLDWETGIGTGEAAETGIIAGLIWTAKELAIELLSMYCKVDCQPSLSVKPNFSGEALYSRFDFSIRLSVLVAIKIRKLNKMFTN